MAMKKKSGMTLIELVVTIAILAIFSVCCFSLITSGLRSYQVTNSQIEGQVSIRAAALVVMRDIRQNPNAFSAAYDGGTLNSMYTVDGGALKRTNAFQSLASTASIDTAGAIAVDIQGISLTATGTGIRRVEITINSTTPGVGVTTVISLRV